MTKAGHQKEPTPPYFIALATYYTFSMLVLFGQLRDFFANLTGHSRYLFIRPRKVCSPKSSLLRGTCWHSAAGGPESPLWAERGVRHG